MLSADFKRYFSKLKRESRVKECFFANDECTSIIKAHSIQNNRILKVISEEGHVIQLNASSSDEDFLIESKDVGRKIATVSTNFCGFHDSKLFSPIELKEFKKGDKEQEFIYAYRAFSREYHAKREIKNVLENIRKASGVDRFSVDLSLKGNQIALEQLEREKTYLNNALIGERFDVISTQVLELHGEYHIASSSACVIEYDLLGNQLNDLSDLKRDLKHIFLTVFPQNGKTFILFSFYKKYKKHFSFIRKQIMTKSLREQKTIITNLLISHVENLVISPRIWSSLLECDRGVIKNILEESVKASKQRLSDVQNINIFIA